MLSCSSRIVTRLSEGWWDGSASPRPKSNTRRRERQTGATGYTPRKMLRLSLQAVMGLSSKPLRFSFYFGLLTAAFCVLYAAFAIVALVAGKTVPGWTSVIVMVTFLGAIQLVSIGIVGEYLARVYDQSRGIPRYVIVESDEASTPRKVHHAEG